MARAGTAAAGMARLIQVGGDASITCDINSAPREPTTAGLGALTSASSLPSPSTSTASAPRCAHAASAEHDGQHGASRDQYSRVDQLCRRGTARHGSRRIIAAISRYASNSTTVPIRPSHGRRARDGTYASASASGAAKLDSTCPVTKAWSMKALMPKAGISVGSRSCSYPA